MTTTDTDRVPIDSASTEPREVLRAALTNLVDAAVDALADWFRRHVSDGPTAHDEQPHSDEDRDVIDAAALLGVAPTSSASEVRSAFRRQIKVALTAGDFHDHGGTATDVRALRLIAAKNLLIDRLRQPGEPLARGWK
jgi:hypothetical protein